MIFSHQKLTTILMLTSFCLYANMAVEEIETSSYETEDSSVRGRKCKTYNNVNVCNNLTVGRNQTVAGSVTANSFITPTGPLVNTISNFAVLSNQAEIAASVDGEVVLWASTPASSLSSGITFDPTTGLITLPTPGLFLAQYTARFENFPFNGDSTVVAQLQQTVAGTPTNISQAAVTSNSTHDIENGDFQAFQRAIIGYALINVTSSNNNVIDLVLTVTNNATIPAATGTDANAQLVIVQLN